VDLDPVLLARIKDRRIVVVCADAAHLPFPPNSFSTLLLVEVLEHVADPGETLAEAKRVLVPNGELIVGVPTAYTEAIYSRLHPQYAMNAGHVRVFRRSALREHITGQGFSINRLEVKNFIPAVSWLFHAVLRSEADCTGTILEHNRVDTIIDLLAAKARKQRYGRAALRRLEARIGKSVYVYATKGA
jgi:SAM-dependent methyltransferase